MEDRNWTEKDFKFERKVGQGAFGAVYKAKNLSTGEIVAIKKLVIQEGDRKNFEGIISEMRILCSIDHKNIVSYKGAFWDTEKKHIFIVMEFLGGGDLNDKIQKCKQSRSSMPESKIWSYFIQLLKGLKVLHDLHIIHRDIKSANCFLTEDLETIKLGDMNVSKVARNNFASTQVGTPLYLSPQVWAGKTYDYKTDIWSLGVLLYEMCTQNYPFMGLNMNALKQAVCKGKFAPIPGYLNQDFSVLIGKMLQMEPTKRPSCDELLNNPIILNKIRNFQDMTISDLKKLNIRLMDTIKIPQNIKNVNLPTKRTNNSQIKRSNSAADIRPGSAQSNRDSPTNRPKLTPVAEKSEVSDQSSPNNSKRMALPPLGNQQSNPPSQANAKALPPIGNKKSNTPLVGRPEPPRPSPSGPVRAPSRERVPSREQLQRQNSRERERELLNQASKPQTPSGQNMRDRYRAPSAGKGARGTQKPVWWGS